MKNCLIFILLIFPGLSYGQQDGYVYRSISKTKIVDVSKLKFLNSIESRVLENAKSGKITPYADINGTLTPITREEFAYLKTDKSPLSFYEAYIKWDYKFDSACVISFSRIYEDNYSKNPDGEQPLFIVPLIIYKSFLEKGEFINLQTIVTDAIMRQYAINQIDSMLFSETILAFDSIKNIPQASITRFYNFLNKAVISGQIAAYKSQALLNPMTRFQWDSITTTSDTNNIDGQFMVIKQILESTQILLVEKWDSRTILDEKQNTYLPCAIHLSRKITAVGFEYSNKKRVYFNYQDVKQLSDQNYINYEAFNQIFLSQVLKKLNAIYTE